jgi:hypothetical protein
MCINASDNALRQNENDGGVLFLLARGILALVTSIIQLLNYVGIHQLATRSMEDALRCFDAVLSTHATNVIALLGKVCTIRPFGGTHHEVHFPLDRHASYMPVDNTHKLLNFSKMSYGITQNVSQTPELALVCVFGLWTRDPEQRLLGNGVWKWYETFPSTTSTWAYPLDTSRTPTTLLHSFCLA